MSNNSFYTLLTTAGMSAIIQARVNGQQIALTHMGVGDGEIIPSQEMVSLGNEQHKFQINSILQDSQNQNYLIVEGVIPSSVGGFYVSEVGIYLEDGTLFAIGNLPKTYKPLLEEGSSKDLTIKVVLEIENSDNVVLKVDDSVVLATREWVIQSLDIKLRNYALVNGDNTKAFKAKKATAADDVIVKQQLDDAMKGAGTPIGVPIPYPSNTIPQNYIECDGSAISRASYAKLFSILGTIWGAGDGSTTFNVPDLRGRAIMGYTETYPLGTVQEDEIKAHQHNIGVHNAKKYGENEQAALYPNQGSRYKTSLTGGDETRPKNLRMKHIMRYE